jgi:hypothetical protein
MKRLLIAFAVLLVLPFAESFRLMVPAPNDDNKLGVWKTYDDFVKGNLTDLGEVSENPKAVKDQMIFFAKEHIDLKGTKYWGGRVPRFDRKSTTFSDREVPRPNTSIPERFDKGFEYRILFNPMPIGVFFMGDKPRVKWDKNGDPSVTIYDGLTYIYFAKADGPVVSMPNRAYFDDDAEVQQAFDKDPAFKGKAYTEKQGLAFIKYVLFYNKKHTAGYKPEIMEYRK